MIRPAVPGDAPRTVPLILQAIGSIAFVLTGTNDREDADRILDGFFRRKDNRVSYQNTLVMEDVKNVVERSREVVGVALIYDGSIARALDEPLEKAAIQRSGLSDYRIPTEAEPSEFYLDTISVDPKCQGRGFGRDLIEASCEQARRLGRDRIGLLGQFRLTLGDFGLGFLHGGLPLAPAHGQVHLDTDHEGQGEEGVPEFSVGDQFDSHSLHRHLKAEAVPPADSGKDNFVPSEGNAKSWPGMALYQSGAKMIQVSTASVALVQQRDETVQKSDSDRSQSRSRALR